MAEFVDAVLTLTPEQRAALAILVGVIARRSRGHESRQERG